MTVRDKEDRANLPAVPSPSGRGWREAPGEGRRTPVLQDEVRHLHGCFFSQPLDDSVIARYEAAHRKVFGDCEPSALVQRVVDKKLDAEAVEFALRRRRKGQDLSKKIQILFYLVEVRSAYLPEFVNTRPLGKRAAVNIFAAVIGAGWKLVKGEYLVRRYGLL